ncbi:MAG: tetratricopeptide repeat protein [Bacteroidota bacterium]
MKIKLYNKTLFTIVAYLTINFSFSFLSASAFLSSVALAKEEAKAGSQDRTKTSGERSRTINSLEIVLQTAKDDTTRINTLNKLAWKFEYTNPDTAIYYSSQALVLAEKAAASPDEDLAKAGEKKIAISYHNLGWFNYSKGNYPLALEHYNKALKISEQLTDKKNIATTLGNIGLVSWQQGNYTKALEYYFKALKTFEELNDKQHIATAHGNIGLIYADQGDYPKTLEYYFKALKTFEELNNKQHIASALGNIGLVYWNHGDSQKALEYFFKALKIDEEIGNRNGIAADLDNIGLVYNNQGDYPKALEYYFKALKIDEELGNKSGIAIDLGNIGNVYKNQGNLSTDDSVRQVNYSKALECLFEALKMNETLGNKYNIAGWLGNIGSLYTQQKKYPEAERYLLQALEVSTEIGALYLQNYHHQNLSDLYKQTGQAAYAAGDMAASAAEYKKAYEHHIEYSAAKDSLFNEEKSKDIGKLEAKKEYDKQLALQKVKQEKQEALAEAERRQQRIIIYAISGGLIMLLAFVLFLYNRFRIIRKQKNIIQKQKEIVDEKNKDITDSIRYAERIQNAILPSDEYISDIFPDESFFVLFKPKDIVSGDFYWVGTVNQYLLFSVIDCTGHGVPGAFMSMIGNDLLNVIINEKYIANSGMVLDELDKKLQECLSQIPKTRKNIPHKPFDFTGEIKDGMDMAFCAWDIKSNILHYAGAFNPMYLFRRINEKPQLLEFKADKKPIGFHYEEKKPFTNHKIDIQKGDTLYIFSDGYPDQFGGEKDKKFSFKRFKELLLSIQDKTMQEQKKILDRTIEDWKGDSEQIDDICVIGVRI